MRFLAHEDVLLTRFVLGTCKRLSHVQEQFLLVFVSCSTSMFIWPPNVRHDTVIVDKCELPAGDSERDG